MFWLINMRIYQMWIVEAIIGIINCIDILYFLTSRCIFVSDYVGVAQHLFEKLIRIVNVLLLLHEQFELLCIAVYY